MNFGFKTKNATALFFAVGMIAATGCGSKNNSSDNPVHTSTATTALTPAQKQEVQRAQAQGAAIYAANNTKK